MRKFKLQMQISLDTFVAGPKGEMDWLIWDWDDELKKYVSDLTEPVDLIILGRKLAEGFIETWTNRAGNPETADDGARKMVETEKIVFSRTIDRHDWANTVINKGDLSEEITKLKNSDGGDIIAYGGGSFVSALIKNNLIDEYNLFVNPVALGSGMTIFGELESKLKLKLVESKTFACGIVGLRYQSAASLI